MHVTRHISRHARAGLAVAVVATAMSFAPVITTSASAAPAGATAPSAAVECSSARTALTQAQKQQRVAKAGVTKARKALKKARKAHNAAKVRKAKKALTRAVNRYNAAGKTVSAKQSRVTNACAAPTSTQRATSTGKALNILAVADGLSVGPIDLGQLTALLDRLLPGVSGALTTDQLGAMLMGFNAFGDGSAINPADALSLLGGAFSPAQVTQLLSGLANPALIQGLAEHILGQVGGLGGLTAPGGFDPTALLDTFAGMFGNLDPSQLGDLLVLITRATGSAGSTFNLSQLTGLLNSLAPGASSAFSSSQLTSMLATLNTHAVSEATLSNLLGGQFSVQQLSSVMSGSAGADLAGKVIAQVLAQLGTAGAGGLSLPSGMGLSQLTSLISTVTDLVGSILGGGGGPLPGLCGIIPLPLLCS